MVIEQGPIAKGSNQKKVIEIFQIYGGSYNREPSKSSKIVWDVSLPHAFHLSLQAAADMVLVVNCFHLSQVNNVVKYQLYNHHQKVS